jgi:hypothetical protein
MFFAREPSALLTCNFFEKALVMMLMQMWISVGVYEMMDALRR